MLSNSSLFGLVPNQRVVLMFNDRLEDSYLWIELLSGGSTKVVSDNNTGVNYLDVLMFESGITYISANLSTLQWMFRGDLDNFPQIQFILSPPEDVEVYNETFVQNFLDDSVKSIMKTLSYVNQILVSSHFSIVLNTKDWMNFNFHGELNTKDWMNFNFYIVSYFNLENWTRHHKEILAWYVTGLCQNKSIQLVQTSHMTCNIESV